MSTVRVDKNQLDPSQDITFASDPDLWFEQKLRSTESRNGG